MKILAVETSSSIASIALSLTSEQEILFKEAEGIQHAPNILVLIEELLATAGLQLKDIDALAFGRGPGSFTGLRIACAVVKGLAYALDIPVYPVSTLAAIASVAQEKNVKEGGEPSPILSLIDARMQQLYWAFYPSKQFNEAEYVTEANKIDIQPEKKDDSFIIAGVGYEPYLPYFSAKIRDRMKLHFNIHPHARALLNLVSSGCVEAVDAVAATPHYIRNHIVQGK